jgi:groucho
MNLNWIFFQGSPSPRANGDHSESRDRDSIGLNGDRNGDKAGSSKLNNDRPPSRSGSSSSRSTPNLKTKDVNA